MTKLDQLITEFCPDGVKYKRFGDLATIVRGGSPRPIQQYITEDPNGVNWIKIGDVTSGSKYITSTKEKIIVEGVSKSRFVKPGDFILSNSMSFGRPYILKIEGCIHDGWLAISDFEANFIPDFLYYLLGSNIIQRTMSQRASSGTVSNLNADIVKSIMLPLPPLPVQREITRILDNYTGLATKLTAELAAELTARKKQYEYYRNELLTFGGTVPMVKLGDVSSIYDGTHQTPTYTSEGVRFVSVENINALKQSKKCISAEDYERLYKVKPQKNDVFMTRIGSIGACAVVEDDEPLAYYVTLTLIRPNQERINSRFLKHAVESIHGKNELWKRTLIHATPIKINLGEIGKISIPLPVLEEQARIVTVLDKFDSLTTDISNSLPIEIEARKKQYEYYRDKLLTFKELEA